MAKNKGVRITVTLECTECRSVPASEKRSPGVSRYTTERTVGTPLKGWNDEVLPTAQQDDSSQRDQVSRH